MVNICVPVLKRYDLLRMMLASLRFSTVTPKMVYVIDNGRDEGRTNTALALSPVPFRVMRPDIPLGVAESWNWFIDNVEEDRIITNDDVTFGTQSIEKMVAAEADIVCAVGFSCFLIRDSCVDKVGTFDEDISPGYGYWEDIDYGERIRRCSNVKLANVDCGVVHLGSQTLAARSPGEMLDHHGRFMLARANYIAKWGKLPAGMA